MSQTGNSSPETRGVSPCVPTRVVEVTNVTDADLERALREAAARGWRLDHVDYVTHAGVKRPVMAFLFFCEPDSAPDGASANA